MTALRTLAIACFWLVHSGLAQEHPRLTLDQALSRALANHPGLLRVQEARLERESARQTAESRLYPQVGLEAIVKEGPPAAPNLNGLGLVNSILTRNYGASFVVSQTLLDSGLRYHAILSRDYEVEAARRLQELEKVRVALGVYRAYYQALLSQSLVHEAERDLELRQTTLSMADIRFRKGLTAKVDVVLAQMQVSEAQAVRKESLTQRHVAYTELQRAQGLDEAADYRVEEPASRAVATEMSLPEQEAALAMRPEVTSLDQQVLARQESAQAAQAESGASLRFLGTAGYLNVAPQNQSANHAYAVGLVLTLPLFDGGASEGHRQEQLHRMAALQAARRELLQTLRSELEKARATLLLHRELEVIREQQREQAQYLVASAQLRYRNGLTSMLEVFQAQLSLSQTTRASAAAHHNRLTAEAEYQFANGRELPW